MFPSHLRTPRRPARRAFPSCAGALSVLAGSPKRFVHSLKTYSRQQVVAVASRSQAKADRVAAEWDPPGLRPGGGDAGASGY